ncbi:MAG: IS1595 family transposase [Alphaproteobacteria bacterium]|nr:IS1595 family transposase [Alphaproteobacteria bacterium]
MADLQSPIFTSEDKARAALEAVRWPNGPVCPHCGGTDRQAKVEGKKHRPGLHYCNHCKATYTATVGTVFERSKVPLAKWWLAAHLMGSSKKGFSAHQLHRVLGVTYKTAWFMAHRLRAAMAELDPPPLGGKGKVVEADETFIGKPGDVFVNGRGWVQMRGTTTKRKVISLVERGGRARSFHVENLDADTIRKTLGANVVLDSRLHTDEAHHYRVPGRAFAKHERVNHSEREYARGDVTTNTVEGFFSIFKRGMKGVYHHCSEAHLQRYLTEFDFRYSNRSALGVEDAERCRKIIEGIAGKRLTYRRTGRGRKVA